MGLRLLKEIGYWCLAATGLARASGWFNRRKILILGYHDVYAHNLDPVDNFDGLRVRVDMLERQIQYLATHYRVVPLDQLFQESSRPGKPVAAITFDDGYKNVYRYAAPLLQRFGLPATIFVIADCSLHGRVPWWERLRAMIAAAQQPAAEVPIQGTKRRFPLVTQGDKRRALLELSAELRRLIPKQREELLSALGADLGTGERVRARGEPISVDEMREIVEQGIGVGAHGRSHDSFLHLSREELAGELRESRDLLEAATGHPVTWLAYPYGEHSSEAVEVVMRAGYEGAVTTEAGLNDAASNPYTLRRVCVDDTLSFAHFVLAVSGLRDVLKGVFRLGQGGRSERTSVPSRLVQG